MHFIVCLCILSFYCFYCFLLLLLSVIKDEGKEESQIINLVASGKQSKRINPDDLMIGDIVGEGSFGTVYRGMYKGMYDVAIKKVIITQIHNNNYILL